MDKAASNFDVERLLQEQHTAATQNWEGAHGQGTDLPEAGAPVEPASPVDRSGNVDLASAAASAQGITAEEAAYEAMKEDLWGPQVSNPAEPPPGVEVADSAGAPKDSDKAPQAAKIPPIPLGEQEQVRRVLDWYLQRMAGPMRKSARKLPPLVVWQDLEQGRGESDVFQNLQGKPAPDWFLAIAREALKAVPHVPPMRAKHEVILSHATGGQILRTLFGAMQGDAVPLLHRTARQLGYQVELGTRGGVRLGNDILMSMRNGYKVAEWARAAGIREEETSRGVMTALAEYAPTAPWMSMLDEEMAKAIFAARHGNRGGLRQQEAVAMTLALQRPEIFGAIPAALEHYRQGFRGPAGKQFDVHFPSRVLLYLHSRWSGKSDDPQKDFAPYFAATPAEKTAVSGELRRAQDRFHTNYALLALGGLGDEYRKDRSGQLFMDLVSRDLVPRNAQNRATLPAGVQERLDRMISTLRRLLEFQPSAIAEDYKYLDLARQPEAQLRMAGLYLSALPHRRQLLGPGELSLWAHNILDPRFAKLLEVSYQPAPQIQPTGVVAEFNSEDRARVREATGLRLLLDSDRLSELAPLVTWLVDEGKALQAYQKESAKRDEAEGLAPNTTAGQDDALLRQLSSLPAEVPAHSAASYVLGLVRSTGSERKVAVAEFGSPADVANLMMSVLTNVALKTEQSLLIQKPEVAESMGTVIPRLEVLGAEWKGLAEDWRALSAVLSEPAFQYPIPPAEREIFATEIMRAIEMQGTDRLPMYAYGAPERAALEQVLAMPCAPSLLRGRAEAEPVHILQAAAVFATELRVAENPTTAFWSKLVDQMKEDIAMLGHLDIVPAPERQEDGSFRRPRRGVRVTAADLADTARLVELAGKAKDPATPWGLPAVPVEAKDWESPSTWLRASRNLDRNLARISSLFGAHLQPRDLARVLEHGSAIAEKEDLQLLLNHASNLARALFTPSDHQPEASIQILIKNTRDLLAAVAENNLQLTPEHGLTTVGVGRISAVAPEKLLPPENALPPPARPLDALPEVLT